MPLNLGLSIFNKAVRDGNPATGFIDFVEEFGTHYIGSAHFGSSFYFEKRFNSRSKNKNQQTDREKCVIEGSKDCIGGGLSVGNVGGNVKTCSKDFENRCSVNLDGNLICSAI